MRETALAKVLRLARTSKARVILVDADVFAAIAYYGFSHMVDAVEGESYLRVKLSQTKDYLRIYSRQPSEVARPMLAIKLPQKLTERAATVKRLVLP